MATFRKTVLSVLLAGVVSVSSVALAQPKMGNKPFDHQQRLEKFTQTSISVTDAIKTAQAKVNGDVLGVRFGTSNGYGYYQVDIIKDNKPERISIDARTGEIIIYRIVDDRFPRIGQQAKQDKPSKGQKGHKNRKEKPTQATKELKMPEVSISLSQAMDIAVAKTGGKVMSANLNARYKAKDRNDTPAYRILTVNEDKTFHTIVDAKNGEVKSTTEFGKPQKNTSQSN